MTYRSGRRGSIAFIALALTVPVALTVMSPVVGEDLKGNQNSASPPAPVAVPSPPSKSESTSSPSATSTGDGSKPAEANSANSGSETNAQPPAPSATPPVPAAATAPVSAPKPMTPADRPPPKGQAAAVKLYSARKFPQAAKIFEQFIKDGTADVSTHAYLAYCLYSMRQYHAALKQFDWVQKYGTKTLMLQRSAEASSQKLRCLMAGVCPMPCLKPTDPRWRHVDINGNRSDDLWAMFPVNNGKAAFSEHHMGDIIVSENGGWVDQGKCPVCGGSGTVTPLKDGDANPQ